ncbi:hypothetical protein [Deinococcus pimensis]|uniref:hypothetical protein n=1 Tax=Deinococcus pimensis TaxID=309888 RepID=UPI0012FA7FC7|nr:hypothetical protein [Deinococcus pimensis]
MLWTGRSLPTSVRHEIARGALLGLGGTFGVTLATTVLAGTTLMYAAGLVAAGFTLAAYLWERGQGAAPRAGFYATSGVLLGATLGLLGALTSA